MGEFFQKHGFVSVVENYRLYPETDNIDEMVEDIYHTFQWALNIIAIYGGNGSQFTLIGHFVGVHLATLTAVKVLKIMIPKLKMNFLILLNKYLIMINIYYKI